MINLVSNLIENISKNQAVRGAIVTAIEDIFVTKICRDNGYTEIKFANAGDTLEVVELDTRDATQVRVTNLDNSEETDYVPLNDVEEF